MNTIDIKVSLSVEACSTFVMNTLDSLDNMLRQRSGTRERSCGRQVYMGLPGMSPVIPRGASGNAC